MKVKMTIFSMLSSAALLSMGITPTALANSTQSEQISTISVNNVPMKAGELGSLAGNRPTNAQNTQSAAMATQVQANTSDSTVDITNASVSGSTVNALSGSVIDTNGTATPFNFTGTLYKDPVSGRIDAGLTDSLGNYKIVRFQIINDPSKGIFYSQAAQSSHAPYLAMYLEKNGTRDITFLETPVANVFGTATWNTIESNANSFADAPKADVFWVEGLFQPDSVTHGSSSTPKYSHPGQLSNTSNMTFEPDSVATEYNYPYYTVNYYTFGYTVQDTMQLEEKVTYPSSTSSSTITGRLDVWYTDYDESDGIDLDQSAWEVGGDGSAGMKLTCPNGKSQRIQWESVAGQLEQSGSWSINWSYSASYAGASLTLAYTPEERIPLNGGGNQDTNGAYIGSFYTSSGDYLNYEGNPTTNAGQDYLSVNWEAPRYSQYGAAGNVTDNVDFVYNMYNSLQNAGTNHGSYRDRLSFTTLAN